MVQALVLATRERCWVVCASKTVIAPEGPGRALESMSVASSSKYSTNVNPGGIMRDALVVI